MKRIVRALFGSVAVATLLLGCSGQAAAPTTTPATTAAEAPTPAPAPAHEAALIAAAFRQTTELATSALS